MFPPHKKLAHSLVAVAVLLFLPGIFQLGYGVLRNDTGQLFGWYGLTFVAYLWLVNSQANQWGLILLALFARILLLFSVPSLSDDFYRFHWDGLMIVNGIHPFAYTPAMVIEQLPVQDLTGISRALFNQLNSPDYFTIYPPVNQAVFWLGAYLFPEQPENSAIVMRGIILLAEAGTVLLLPLVLKQYQLNITGSLWYSLNPLIIIELTGNLHFEALMLFFLLASVYLLNRNLWGYSAACFALAVCAKLVPLILLPLLMKRLGAKKATGYYGLTGLFTLLMFLPLLDVGLVRGMQESIGLYFQKFEFNASVYYVVREIGYWVTGYNIIQTAGKYLAGITLVGIVLYSVFERKKRLPESFMWVFGIYFLLASIVHPWYASSLVLFSTFSKYRFPVVWSFTVFFSYLGYRFSPYRENLWITGIEYGLVIVVMLYEILATSESKKEIVYSE